MTKETPSARATSARSRPLEVTDEFSRRNFRESVVHHALHDDDDFFTELRLHGVNDKAAVLADPSIDVLGETRQFAVKKIVHADASAGDVEVNVGVGNDQPLIAVGRVDGDDVSGAFADGTFQSRGEVSGAFNGHDDNGAVDLVITRNEHARYEETQLQRPRVDIGLDVTRYERR